ncbi:hypothetical protein DUK53_16055 [Listeria sp. SHR_NRA_18]|uniref:hypothetical protein n=1 Tax=Listeria sp. SHR_NRA_18 TaxID=2269046 RepID=UPI000F60220F|nr:hypothetical protein [Listeria sp. SHR_NRA_18]RQW65465.1 hypothetical protein DUK53_16055 [Listeria sp. SHR_NRA_18]
MGIDTGGIFEPVCADTELPSAQPILRETIEIWDPVHKCKVKVYKDELLKELNKSRDIRFSLFESAAI